MKIELSNYWDDFQKRVNETIDNLSTNQLPTLERLTVHLTESCNFNCEYCNMCLTSKHMSTNLLEKIIDEYKGSIIHFTGGEPTVYPRFKEACEYAKAKGLVVSVNTNAYKKVDVSSIDKLKASFDTPFEDEFNSIVGSNSFNTVVSNMKYYSKEMKNKMLSITAVLNRKTYKNMLALAVFVDKEFDVYNLYFSNYKGNNPEFAFSDEEIEDMFINHIPKVLEFFKQSGNSYSYKQLGLYKRHDFRNVDERFAINKEVPCYIQLSEMTIDVNGLVHNCSHLFRDGVKSFETYDLNELSVDDAFYRLKNDFKGNYLFLDKKCLNGCNTNLIGFNRHVHSNTRI